MSTDSRAELRALVRNLVENNPDHGRLQILAEAAPHTAGSFDPAMVLEEIDTAIAGSNYPCDCGLAALPTINAWERRIAGCTFKGRLDGPCQRWKSAVRRDGIAGSPAKEGGSRGGEHPPADPPTRAAIGGDADG